MIIFDLFEDNDKKPQTPLTVDQLATISDAALDAAYGYGRSSPGNTFGWQANLKSAAFAKQMIDRGVTDIEAISDAIHRGWNVTAQAFVKNPMQFDDSKTMAPEKLQAKLAQRQKLMTQQYAQLPEEEKEKDRVVARAMLQAITGEQGVAEGEHDDQFINDEDAWYNMADFARKEMRRGRSMADVIGYLVDNNYLLPHEMGNFTKTLRGEKWNESVEEGSGGPSWPEVISALTQGYPDIDPIDALKPLMQKYRVSYNYFDKLAQQQGYKDVFDAYAEFEELPTTGPTMSKGVAEGTNNDLPYDWYVECIDELIQNNRRMMSPSRLEIVAKAVQRDVARTAKEDQMPYRFSPSMFKRAYKEAVAFNRDMNEEQGVAEANFLGQPGGIPAEYNKAQGNVSDDRTKIKCPYCHTASPKLSFGRDGECPVCDNSLPAGLGQKALAPKPVPGIGMSESAGPDEYYIWTVHFANPEKNPPRRVRVYSDEFVEELEGIKKFYAKKGLTVVDVDTDVGIRSEPKIKPERYEVDESSQSFHNGMQVKLTPEYADRPDEIFTVSQCDRERGRCWIGDQQGRGWSASFDQLIPVEDDEVDEDSTNFKAYRVPELNRSLPGVSTAAQKTSQVMNLKQNKPYVRRLIPSPTGHLQVSVDSRMIGQQNGGALIKGNTIDTNGRKAFSKPWSIMIDGDGNIVTQDLSRLNDDELAAVEYNLVTRNRLLQPNQIAQAVAEARVLAEKQNNKRHKDAVKDPILSYQGVSHRVKGVLKRAYAENPGAKNDIEAIVGHIASVDDTNQDQQRQISMLTKKLIQAQDNYNQQEQRFQELTNRLRKQGGQPTPQDVQAAQAAGQIEQPVAAVAENTPKMSARKKLQRAVDREKKQAQQDRTGLTGMDYDQVQRQLRGIQDRTKPKKVDEVSNFISIDKKSTNKNISPEDLARQIPGGLNWDEVVNSAIDYLTRDSAMPISKIEAKNILRQPGYLDSLKQHYNNKAVWENQNEAMSEDKDIEQLERAIMHRIMVGRKDLLLKHSPQRVMEAVENVASNSHNDNTDVNGCVHRVEQILDDVSEAKAVKTRLDPACWDNKRIGHPKTKVKNGVRVNNCVPK